MEILDEKNNWLYYTFYRPWDKCLEILDKNTHNILVLLQSDGWRSWIKTHNILVLLQRNGWRSWMKRTIACYYRLWDEQVEILDEKNIWMLLLTMGLMHGEPG